MSWRGWREKKKEQALFLGQALARYREVGMFMPSAPRLAARVAGRFPAGKAATIVEVGAGTGAITRFLLPRLGAQGRLICVEKNPDFCRHLRETLPKDRVEVVEAAFEELPALRPDLLAAGVDGVVFCLAPILAPEDLRRCWAGICDELLSDGGHLLVQQFIPVLDRFLPPSQWERVDRTWLAGCPPFRVDLLRKR